MKFSIRDLLLVTVIVALAVGWWMDHRRQAASVSEWMERAYASEHSLSQELARMDQMKSDHEETAEYYRMRTDKLYDELIELSEKVPDNPIKGSTLPTSPAPAPNPPKE